MKETTFGAIMSREKASQKACQAGFPDTGTLQSNEKPLSLHRSNGLPFNRMVMRSAAIVSVFMLACVGNTWAGSAMLRVVCDAKDAGAQVYANEKFRGECPVDFQVSAGPIKLRVHKKVIDAFHERVFEREFRMAEDSVKKVEVDYTGLSPRLTAGGKQQERAAFQSALKAAEAGDADAMVKVASLYRSSETTPRNEVQSVFWNRKAATANNAEAMTHLAFQYQKGEGGLAKNETEAAQWMRKAADLGDASAMYFLADYYKNGIGVAANREQAIYWLRKGASGPAPYNEWSIDELKSLGVR